MVFDKVKDIIVDQLDVDEDEVTMEASITEDLGADSLDVVDLIMSLEEEFDIKIPDEEVENVKTVGDIVKFIEEIDNQCERFDMKKPRNNIGVFSLNNKN